MLTNDAKWVMCEQEWDFLAYPGMNIDGLAGEQSLKISGLSYDIKEKTFKLRLAWLSAEPINSSDMFDMNVGWEIASR